MPRNSSRVMSPNGDATCWFKSSCCSNVALLSLSFGMKVPIADWSPFDESSIDIIDHRKNHFGVPPLRDHVPTFATGCVMGRRFLLFRLKMDCVCVPLNYRWETFACGVPACTVDDLLRTPAATLLAISFPSSDSCAEPPPSIFSSCFTQRKW